MVWAEAIGQAIAYIESHIADELSVGEIAKQVNLSPFYFQKGFSLLCGLTVMEYIRKRSLALDARCLFMTVRIVLGGHGAR